jgi:hypothetical protein
MTDHEGNAMEGGCTCAAVRYRLKARPLFVHCCHCTWCQRETGSAFAVNAMIEASQVELLKGKPTRTTLPSASGKGQVFWRCADCGAIILRQVRIFISYGWERSTIPRAFRLTFTSTRRRSSLGLSCRTTFLRSRNSTARPNTGRPRAERGSKQRETLRDKFTQQSRSVRILSAARCVRWYRDSPTDLHDHESVRARK